MVVNFVQPRFESLGVMDVSLMVVLCAIFGFVWVVMQLNDGSTKVRRLNRLLEIENCLLVFDVSLSKLARERQRLTQREMQCLSKHKYRDLNKRSLWTCTLLHVMDLFLRVD